MAVSVTERQAGRRRAEKAPTAPRAPVALLLCTGAVLAGAGWVSLVRAAIGFGRGARDGDGGLGWLLAVFASLGATLCLLLVFVLLARMGASLRHKTRYRPRRATGSRRAR